VGHSPDTVHKAQRIGVPNNNQTVLGRRDHGAVRQADGHVRDFARVPVQVAVEAVALHRALRLPQAVDAEQATLLAEHQKGRADAAAGDHRVLVGADGQQIGERLVLAVHFNLHKGNIFS